MSITIERLRQAVAKDAAIRRVQKLQPVGGAGDKIFPPTYPGERSSDPARHVFETRRIDGNDVRCVLIDSVQSQANRLEEALLGAMRAGRIAIPHITVAFKNQKTSNGIDLSDLGEVTSLDAPHRVFDAIIRDSQLDGMKFTDTDHYKVLLLAKPANAVQVFKARVPRGTGFNTPARDSTAADRVKLTVGEPPVSHQSTQFCVESHIIIPIVIMAFIATEATLARRSPNPGRQFAESALDTLRRSLLSVPPRRYRPSATQNHRIHSAAPHAYCFM